jgi:hypothetical protein
LGAGLAVLTGWVVVAGFGWLGAVVAGFGWLAGWLGAVVAVPPE